jgi:tRNA pseudouridine38-40 synthase
MVGCLKYLGEKKWSLKRFESVMKSRQRSLCAPLAPPEGLYLSKIIY